MKDLEEDLNILSRLLEETRGKLRTKLCEYATEDRHMRMQLVLRDYFKEEKAQMKPDIEQEARSIAVIFPDIPVEIIQDMLIETGDQTDRSRFVIKKLCTKKSNATKLTKESSGQVDDNKNEMFDRDKFNEVRLGNETEGRIQSQSESHLSDNSQPSTSSHVDLRTYIDQVPTCDRNLFRDSLEAFPDASPKYLKSLCERRDFTDLSLAETVQSLLDGDYPKRIGNAM